MIDLNKQPKAEKDEPIGMLILVMIPIITTFLILAERML